MAKPNNLTLLLFLLVPRLFGAAMANFTDAKAYGYLRRYGYMPDVHSKEIYNAEESIRTFQRFANIPVTGRIDDRTREAMQRRRCGVPDVRKFVANYKLSGNQWEKTNLTYKVLTYSKDISVVTQRETLTKIFAMWSRVIPLDFTEVASGAADIDIKFAVKDHGDSISFDGKGGVLAHAFYPTNGNIHFDDDEDWAYVDLQSVAVHELGHSIGLDHSEDMESVMAPFYKGPLTNRNLTQDDIAGAQAIYGKRSSSETTTEATTTPPTTTTEATTPPTTTTEATTPPTTTTEATTTPPTTTTEATTTPPTTTTEATTTPPTTTTTEASTTPPTITTGATKTTPAPPTTSVTSPGGSSSARWTLPSTSESLLSTILFSTKDPMATTETPTPTATTMSATPSTPTTTRTPTTPAQPPNIPNFECPFPYTALMKYYSEGYLAFIESQVFKLDQFGFRRSGPHHLRSVFDKTPPYVSAAAFDSSTNASYLFSNVSVWKYVDNRLDPGYPKAINTFVIGAVVMETKIVLFSLFYTTEMDKGSLEVVYSRRYRLFGYPVVPFYFADTVMSRTQELVYIKRNGYTICEHEELCFSLRRC